MSETARQLNFEPEEKSSYSEAELEDLKQEIAKNRQYIMNFVKRFANGEDKSAIEDITQTVLEKATKSAHTRDSSIGAALKSWLGTITRNAVNDYFKRKSIEKTRIFGGVEIDPILEKIPAANETGDSLLRKQLQAALEKLTPTDRKILLESQDGASYEEISRELGNTDGTVGWRLNRIKSKLRKILEHNGVDPGDFFGKKNNYFVICLRPSTNSIRR